MKNYFDVLKVGSDDSDRKIFLAYRKLARNSHPKKYPEKRQEFLEVHRAYEALRTQERTRFYSSLLTNPKLETERNKSILAKFEKEGMDKGLRFAENLNLFKKKVVYFAIIDIAVNFLGISITGEIFNFGLFLGLLICTFGVILGVSSLDSFELSSLFFSLMFVINGILLIRQNLIKLAMNAHSSMVVN